MTDVEWVEQRIAGLEAKVLKLCQERREYEQRARRAEYQRDTLLHLIQEGMPHAEALKCYEERRAFIEAAWA
jgi:hypothetical protein